MAPALHPQYRTTAMPRQSYDSKSSWTGSGWHDRGYVDKRRAHGPTEPDTGQQHRQWDSRPPAQTSAKPTAPAQTRGKSTAPQNRTLGINITSGILKQRQMVEIDSTIRPLGLRNLCPQPGYFDFHNERTCRRTPTHNGMTTFFRQSDTWFFVLIWIRSDLMTTLCIMSR